MVFDKVYFEKKFSAHRMDRYYSLYPNDETRAIKHYECNISLSESLYTSISIFEVTLRNALSRELSRMSGIPNWYNIFQNHPNLGNLNHYIEEAKQHIFTRHEAISPSKVVSELTLGFWVSLLNSEYERTLWQALRRAFPHMPRNKRQRRNVSAPLNTFRRLRNRIFHNEPICWNLERVETIHNELVEVIGWMDRDLPLWLKKNDRFDDVCIEIRKKMGWKIKETQPYK